MPTMTDHRLIRFGRFSQGKWHVDRKPDSTWLSDHVTVCGVEPAGRSLVSLAAGSVIPPDHVCKRCARMICQHCGAYLTREPGVGLVDLTSGDDGGTYDYCPGREDGHETTPIEEGR